MDELNTLSLSFFGDKILGSIELRGVYSRVPSGLGLKTNRTGNNNFLRKPGNQTPG
jgi:hypothetical protein